MTVAAVACKPHSCDCVRCERGRWHFLVRRTGQRLYSPLTYATEREALARGQAVLGRLREALPRAA